MDIPGPILVLVGGTIVVAAYHYHLESEAARRAAQHVRRLLPAARGRSDPPLVAGARCAGAHKREITILFSDIKGFTNLTAAMDAGHVRTLLNEYFGRMIEIVFRHEGTLDKFLGDGLMVFFGDPEPQPDHAARCVRAAIEMQQAARQLDRGVAGARRHAAGRSASGSTPARRSSATWAPRAGCPTRRSAATVNLAQRLEASAPVGGILISERTNEQLAGALPTLRREPIQVKGIDEAARGLRGRPGSEGDEP